MENHMQYQILINDQLYKTVTSTNGYSFTEILRDLGRERASGALSAFGVDTRMKVEILPV